MASDTVNNYISKRYDRWLDYAMFHCGLAGIPDEANDVLNEVLYSLLLKDNDKLMRLHDTKRSGYTELDFFVLRMIKLNVCSPTSPYQSKYKSLPADANVDYSRLDVEDVNEEAIDEKAVVLERIHQVREVLNELDLSSLAYKVFEYRFFHDLNFSDWEGPETLKELYEVYNGVQELIRKKITGESIF